MKARLYEESLCMFSLAVAFDCAMNIDMVPMTVLLFLLSHI